MQRKSPYLIRPGHGYIQESLIERQSKSVGRDTVVQQSIESAIDSETIYSARLISHTGLPLVGKEDVVLAINDYVVDAFETFKIVPCEQSRNLV